LTLATESGLYKQKLLHGLLQSSPRSKAYGRDISGSCALARLSITWQTVSCFFGNSSSNSYSSLSSLLYGGESSHSATSAPVFVARLHPEGFWPNKTCRRGHPYHVNVHKLEQRRGAPVQIQFFGYTCPCCCSRFPQETRRCQGRGRATVSIGRNILLSCCLFDDLWQSRPRLISKGLYLT